MKRIITSLIALVLSIVLLSQMTSDSTAKAHAAVWVTVGFFEVVSSPQTVQVDTPRGSYDALFHNEVQVRNGVADGFLTMTVPDTAGHPGGVNVVFVGGSVRFHRDGTVAAVRLRGHTADGRRIQVNVTPAATEDCLIYTTVGSGFHATWEAQGRLTIRE